MYGITLICTRHYELGKCNSEELHKIIESISPEIIFEELSHYQFMQVYDFGTLATLETNAIKMYLQNHEIKHLSVDTYKLSNSYYQEIDSMEVIFNYMFDESRRLRELVDNQMLLLSQNGFNLLNSKRNDDFLEELSILKKSVLDIVNDERLFRINRLETESIDNREYKIIENIYNYSKENQYNKALLLIGSGHRKSIIEKIEKYKTQEDVKLNWTLYSAETVTNDDE